MELERLKNVLIDQAKYFLANAGEFYPFGAVISTDGDIVPLGAQFENDRPTPQEVIGVLENSILRKLSKNEVKIAGIGTDVNYKPAGETEKKSAIQVRILESSGVSVDYYLPYRNETGNFVYEALFEEKGTLNFLNVI